MKLVLVVEMLPALWLRGRGCRTSSSAERSGKASKPGAAPGLNNKMVLGLQSHSGGGCGGGGRGCG